MDYLAIGHSKTPLLSKRVVNLVGATVGFSYIGTGTANFAFGKKDGVYHAEKSTFYEDLLDDARQVHIVVHDTKEHRAWHTNAEVAILQIILHRYELKSRTRSRAVEFRMANAAVPDSVRDAMFANQDIVVMRSQRMDNSEVNTKRFRDLVGEIFTTIEGLKAYSEDVTAAGIELKMNWKRHVHGWEYMDLVDKRLDFRQKEAELKGTCGYWPEFARDTNAVILFGTQFGGIIRPSNIAELCDQFKAVPKHKHYLTIHVSALCQLYYKYGCSEDQEQITITGIRWHRSKNLFESCRQTRSKADTPCRCDRIQEFLPRKAFSKGKPPGKLEPSGAVIFGQQASSWKNELIQSWSNIGSALSQQTNTLAKSGFIASETSPSQVEPQSLSTANLSWKKASDPMHNTPTLELGKRKDVSRKIVDLAEHHLDITEASHRTVAEETMAFKPKFPSERRMPTVVGPLPRMSCPKEHATKIPQQKYGTNSLSWLPVLFPLETTPRAAAALDAKDMGRPYVRTFGSPQGPEARNQMASRSRVAAGYSQQISHRQGTSDLGDISTSVLVSAPNNVNNKPALHHKRNSRNLHQEYLPSLSGHNLYSYSEE